MGFILGGKKLQFIRKIVYNTSIWYTTGTPYMETYYCCRTVYYSRIKKGFSTHMDESGKLIAVIGDEDTVTGFLLAGVGHRNAEGQNFLVVKPGKSPLIDTYSLESHNIL